LTAEALPRWSFSTSYDTRWSVWSVDMPARSTALDMNEAVAAAAFRRNEAIALVDIEEFYGADGHQMFLSRNTVSGRERARSQEEA
jgi:hypothetical protein